MKQVLEAGIARLERGPRPKGARRRPVTHQSVQHGKLLPILHMCSTCATVTRMAKMIQVRNVPERLHRELMRRAKERGQTLTSYVQELLERETAWPPREEVFARVARHKRIRLPVSAAELVRQERPPE